MKSIKSLRRGMAVAAATIAALALVVCAAPRKAEAAPTSAGATVYNKVTVTYASGSVSGLVTSSSVKVTVTTLAAAPTVTIDSQTASILSGATNLYTYTIKSNSNGTDTYTVSKDASSTDTNMFTANSDSIASTGIPLWGGYAVGSGAGYITVPGGSLALNPIADGKTVRLTVGGTADQTYTVASTSAGNAQSDGVSETLDTIYLNPVSGPAITAGNVATGTQVGEYTTFTNTVTAGQVNIDPSNATITDGTHVTVIKVVTTATGTSGVITYLTKSGDSNLATTTILAPKLGIVKKSRNFTAGEAAFTTSGTTARPGEVVEYEITITNLHSAGGATIDSANVVDILPSYSTYVGNSTQIKYNAGSFSAIADDAGASPLAGSGHTLTSPLAAGEVAVIVYRATVN